MKSSVYWDYFFPNMLHVSVYICVYICFCICTWTGVGIHYSTGRQASGRHLAHWLVCRSRAHQGASTVLHCTGRCTREETKEGAPGIHLGPDNSLRFGLLPVASSHIAWTFGFFGFQWRHQEHCGVTSGHLEWTDWFNWLVSHKFHYFQLGSTLWAAIIILAGRCQKTEWEVNQWQLFLFEVLAIRSS